MSPLTAMKSALRLTELIACLPEPDHAMARTHAPVTADPQITGLTADSREVRDGYLFAALPAQNADGADYVRQAEAAGAKAVLTSPAASARLETELPVISAENPRRAYALMAARFYRRQPRRLVACTGTNGKTSVVSFVHQIWRRLGYKAASLGTLGLHGGSDRPDTAIELAGPALTTPDAAHLHRALAAAADAGIEHLAMEASSHGLDQNRLDGVRLTAAGFTNLSRDHLDYHQTEARYFAAKRYLFEAILPKDGVAVINIDTEHGRLLADQCRRRGQRVLTFGLDGPEKGGSTRFDIAAPMRHADGAGHRVTIKIGGLRRTIASPLVGDFQISNLLCAIGLTIGCGADSEAVLDVAGGVVSAPGRMQLVGRRFDRAPIFVDYAHTPDALRRALESLRPSIKGRLIVLFGCGGDRDPGKRPLMGAVAAEQADRVIVTDDNPRTEDAAAIRSQILAACPGATEIADRGQAIAYAVASLGPDDALLIAGKGHETGQIIGTITVPFHDADAVADALASLGSENGQADR